VRKIKLFLTLFFIWLLFKISGENNLLAKIKKIYYNIYVRLRKGIEKI